MTKDICRNRNRITPLRDFGFSVNMIRRALPQIRRALPQIRRALPQIRRALPHVIDYRAFSPFFVQHSRTNSAMQKAESLLINSMGQRPMNQINSIGQRPMNQINNIGQRPMVQINNLNT